MTTTITAPALPAEVTDLTARLREPLTLLDIVNVARHPSGAHGVTVAALLTKWVEGAGAAKDALLQASAGELAAAVELSARSCEECRTCLPDWMEQVRDDHGITYCPTCAVDDQRANPENWREWALDRSADIYGGIHD